MARHRVNPFDQGTAERVLFDRYRRATLGAEANERHAATFAADARVQRSAAERYAEELRALGHGDKVPGQKALPDYAAWGSAA